MTIFDAHTHLPSRNRSKTTENPYLLHFPDYHAAVRYAKNAGIDGMVFNTIEGVWCDTAEELESANREALEIYESDPGFFYPGVSIHPAFPEISIEWIKRFRNAGFLWVGELVHYRGQGDYDRTEWMKLFRICCDYEMTVQLHESRSVPRLARLLPELRIVQSHITIQDLPEAAACPNVMLDVSGAQGGLKFGAMEAALRHFGPERILFGTDFMIYQIEAFKLRAEQAFPDLEIRQKICAGNLRKILPGAFHS